MKKTTHLNTHFNQNASHEDPAYLRWKWQVEREAREQAARNRSPHFGPHLG